MRIITIDEGGSFPKSLEDISQRQKINPVFIVHENANDEKVTNFLSSAYNESGYWMGNKTIRHCISLGQNNSACSKSGTQTCIGVPSRPMRTADLIIQDK